MGRILTVCAVLVLLAPVVWGRDPGAERLAKAEALARGGQIVEAAGLYGKELAAAQKKGDLPRQEQITRSMQSALSGASARGPDSRDGTARALRAVMLALDPRKHYVFCSAGRLAHELLLEATRTGNTAFVEEAAKACAQHAKIAKVGPFAGVMVDYAAGLLEVAAGNPANAIEPLGAALAATSTEGWAEPSVHIATELAAACVAAGQVEGAANALTQAGSVLKYSGDTSSVQRFRALVKARLEGAPESVLDAYTVAMEPFSRGASAGAAGGRGAAGGSAGGKDVSKVGRAWEKLSARKPFVTVTRAADGYVIRQAFDKRFEAEQPVGPGVKHHDDGGITLSFWDGGVRLTMLDMTGLNGQPGESSERGSFLFFDPVARGATWGVTKKGLVTHTKGR